MRTRYYVFILSLAFILFSCRSDQPKKLSGKMEVVDFTYIQWACDCARFLDVKNLNVDLDEDELAAKCVFIEPSEFAENISNEYYNGHFNKYLRLTGQYYNDEGIPSSYEQLTGEKPAYARVFRYDKVEYVEK